jgi:hypothetical protein
MIEYSIQQYEKDYREGCDLEDARTLPPTEALLLVGKLINASNAPQKPPGMTHAIVLGQQLFKQGTLRLRDAALLHYASPREALHKSFESGTKERVDQWVRRWGDGQARRSHRWLGTRKVK